MSYKENWIKEGINEGYLSAMRDTLWYVSEFRKDSLDDWIVEFELREKEFLNYFEKEELDFIDIKLLNRKATEVWLSK